MMGNQVYVIPGDKCKPGRIGILEEDDAHPLEELSQTHRALVTCDDEEPVLVGMTALVAQKVQNGELKVADKKAPESNEAEAEAAPRNAPKRG
jgi:hypothetical protein